MKLTLFLFIAFFLGACSPKHTGNPNPLEGNWLSKACSINGAEFSREIIEVKGTTAKIGALLFDNANCSGTPTKATQGQSKTISVNETEISL